MYQVRGCVYGYVSRVMHGVHQEVNRIALGIGFSQNMRVRAISSDYRIRCSDYAFVVLTTDLAIGTCNGVQLAGDITFVTAAVLLMLGAGAAYALGGSAVA